MDKNTVDNIKQQIETNAVLLYMKGTPQFPQCGFSARVAQILHSLNAEFSYVNILEQPDIRATLPKYANWPTFPQLYIQGELVGGCDIISDLHETKALQPLLESAGALGKSGSVKSAI